jgi:hypothetical protein
MLEALKSISRWLQVFLPEEGRNERYGLLSSILSGI